MAEAAWRRRYRAPRTSFPAWARDAADRLTYISNEPGRFEVFAWDRATGARRQVTDRPEGTGYRVPPRLEPDGERVWWWDDDRGNEFGVWRAEPFGGGGTAEPAAPGLAPSYSAGLALGAHLAVIGRSTEEGSSAYLVPHGDRPVRLYAHREHASVGGISHDDALVALSHSEHGDSRNPAVRVLDLAGATVAEAWDGPGRGLSPGQWAPRRGDPRVLVTHERGGLERPLVLRADTGEQRELAIDLPGEVSASWYPDGERLLLLHEHRGRSELYRLELASGALDRLPTPSGTISAARARPDGDVWLHLSRSAEPPAVVSLSGEVVLRPAGERAPSGVAYADRDVAGVHAFVAEPPRGRPHPTIFIVHGGPEANDRDEFSPGVQAWVDHGFAVVLVNYRGSTGYGKAWRDAIRGRPGLTELEDVAKVRDALVADGLADPRRLVLSGGSWGGYLTLLGLGTQAEAWALGIAGVPIGDYVAAFEDEMEPLKRYDAALFGGTPDQVPEVYRERNPITYVERVRAPVLMLVGQNDPRCPSRSADVYEARLRELGKTFETYRYEAGHGSLVIEEQLRQVERQIAFTARHLGTRPPIA